MSQNDDDLFDIENDLDYDPFAENEANTPEKKPDIILEEERSFKEVRKILNKQKTHDSVFTLKSILNGETYNIRIPEEPKKEPKHHYPAQEEEKQLDKPDKIIAAEKVLKAQKDIRDQLRQIRNKLKIFYQQTKSNEKLEKNLTDPILKDAINSDHQALVDYILLAMAGIHDKNSPEYHTLSKIHYNVLVVYVVKFMSSYKELALDKFSQFSGIQFAFRNYLYEKRKISFSPMETEKKQIAMPTVEEHISILERLNHILQNILIQLRLCLAHFKPNCTLFGTKQQIAEGEDDGRDHKHGP